MSSKRISQPHRHSPVGCAWCLGGQEATIHLQQTSCIDVADLRKYARDTIREVIYMTGQWGAGGLTLYSFGVEAPAGFDFASYLAAAESNSGKVARKIEY